MFNTGFDDVYVGFPFKIRHLSISYTETREKVGTYKVPTIASTKKV